MKRTFTIYLKMIRLLKYVCVCFEHELTFKDAMTNEKKQEKHPVIGLN